MRKLIIGSTVLFGALFMIGCGDDSDATTNVTQAVSSVEQCKGTFSCTIAGEDPTRTELASNNGVCFAGGIGLHDDGRATADDIDADMTWRTTSAGFDICITGAGCLSCTSIDPSPSSSSRPSPSPKPAAKKSCEGAAASCFGRPPWTCVTHRGCSFSSFAYECEGSSDGCYMFKSESSCALQEGCSWR
jgi:hypothetical protein